MASRSSSPSPGQSGQDDRDDDADSASGRNLEASSFDGFDLLFLLLFFRVRH